MGKLNQVIAVVASKKKKAAEATTNAYHLIQKGPLFDGIAKTYRPKDEDGDRLPAESKAIQVKVKDLIADSVASLTEMWDVIATQDHANTLARGDVVIQGAFSAPNVPVTYLLFLEKQLKDVETFVGKLPTLDPSEKWVFNKDADCYATEGSETVRTKKVPRAFVKSPATKEHPAQVETFHEDVVAGYWNTIKFSGAIPAQEKNEILARIRLLSEAVVKAREAANGIEAPSQKVGKEVFGYIFGN